MPLVEDDAVAGLDQLSATFAIGELHHDAVLRLADDRADADAAALGETALHERLVVHAIEKARA